MRQRPVAQLLAPLIVLCLAQLACGGAPPVEQPAAADPAYLAEIEGWRSDRAQRLQRPDGWLSLTGLYWLQEGDNRFGSDPANDIVFPADEMPPTAGVLTRAQGRVTLSADPAAGLTHDGEPLGTLELASDAAGEPTVVTRGGVSFYVIARGERLGIRVKNASAPALLAFHGIESFPVDPRWRVEARFEAYTPPKMMEVPNVLGTPTQEPVPGALLFEIAGAPQRLEAMAEGNELFIVFGDRTNGHETYGGGRFVYADQPSEDGFTTLDFNKAYNPPCVFTPFATCPLPPASNRLALRVEAGEKMYGAQH